MATTIKKNNLANIRDYLLDIDDIKQPKVVDMTKIEPGVLNSAAVLIIRLLLLKKGTYSDFPDMGIDIRGRYRFAYEDEMIELQNDIASQIESYLPELLPVDVVVSMQTPAQNNLLINTINISITASQTKYVLLYDISENTLAGIKMR